MITSNSISKWYIAMNSASINDTFQQQVSNRYVSSFNLISMLEILIYILYSILYSVWLIYHYIYEGIRSLLFSFTLHFNHQNHSYELYNALIHLITIYICYVYTILSYESLWTSIKTNWPFQPSWILLIHQNVNCWYAFELRIMLRMLMYTFEIVIFFTLISLWSNREAKIELWASFTLHFKMQNRSYSLYNGLIHHIVIYICYLYTILT
mgnify:CR=1 FL=1